jgi:2-hydroxy-6-oxonona-2,4-dienedioate hydrolase
MEVIWTPVDGLRVHAPQGSPTPEGCPPMVLVHGLVVSSHYMVPTLKRLAAYHLAMRLTCPASARARSPVASWT